MNSKRKGTRCERELVQVFRAHDWRCGRVPLSGAGAQRGDVAVPDSGLHVECKAVERFNIWAALAQADADAPADRLPVVCFKRNRSRWFVALGLDDFLELLDLARAGNDDLRAAVARWRVERPDLVDEWRDYVREDRRAA